MTETHTVPKEKTFVYKHFPDFEAYVRLDANTIFVCPEKRDGSLAHFGLEIEVDDPSKDFLEAVNKTFGTKFTMSQFAGR